MASDERVTFRPFTEYERRVLDELTALPGGVAETAKLAGVAVLLAVGPLWVVGRWMPVLARLALPAGVGLAAYTAFQLRRFRARTAAARAAAGDPLADDARRGEAEVARYEVVDAISVEPIEDEGAHWFLRLRDGGVLFLSGQEFGRPDQAGAFPWTAVEVSRAPRARTVLDVNGAGAPVPPSTVLAPFPRQGGVPAHGDLLDADFEAIRRGEVHGNAPGRWRARPR